MMTFDPVPIVWHQSFVDGTYYPRFFFVNREGVIDYSIAGRKEGELYRYFYSSLDTFKEQMRKLL